MRKLRSHNDEATFEDAFGRRRFVEQICAVISDCDPPKGIGINGYWGSGKTSVLKQIFLDLTGKAPDGSRPRKARHPDALLTAVWFEAWRYQHEPVPIVALLNEIRAQLGLWEKLKGKSKKLAKVTVLGSLSAFDEVMRAASGGLFRPSLGEIPRIGSAVEAESREGALPSEEIRQLLEEAIDGALAKPKEGRSPRLVIFIDDLDRCEPETALRLLEGIKVYLNLGNCVTVLGMDQRQIERALARALQLGDPDDQRVGHHAREYLEKICQDVFHLPHPSMEVKGDFLCGLLGELDPVPEDVIERLRSVVHAYDCLPANPRKIKALANRLAHMLPAIAQADADDPGADGEELDRAAAITLVLSILYCFHRPLFEQVDLDAEFLNIVLDYATIDRPPKDVADDPRFGPMAGLLPSQRADGPIPVNPSDSNVFRLHQILQAIGEITRDEAAGLLPR